LVGHRALGWSLSWNCDAPGRSNWLGLGRAALLIPRAGLQNGRRHSRAKHLESQSSFPGCRRDRRLCNLDAAKTSKAGCERPRRRDGCLACAQSRQGRHAADNRARYSNRYRRYCYISLHAADRLAAWLFCQHQRPWRASANACHRRRRLRSVDELLRLGGLRLHGGSDWFLQQPAVWHWHFGGDRRCAAACVRRKTVRVTGGGQGANGVRAGNIDWTLIRRGGFMGVCIIVLDEILARTTRHMRVPPLAVGLGIYLPTQSTLMIVVGAIAGWVFDNRADHSARPEATKQLGVLLASGLIVGESVIGVVISAIVVFSGVSAPLALVGPRFETAAIIIGGIAFATTAMALYRWSF